MLRKINLKVKILLTKDYENNMVILYCKILYKINLLLLNAKIQNIFILISNQFKLDSKFYYKLIILI